MVVKQDLSDFYFQAWMAQALKVKKPHEQHTFPKNFIPPFFVDQTGKRAPVPQDLQQQGYPQDVFLGQVQAPPACQALRVDAWMVRMDVCWWFWYTVTLKASRRRVVDFTHPLKRWDCWKMNWLSPALGVQGLGELAGCVSPGTHRR